MREYGFEPVLNEHGAIPYASYESPERGAYREVDLCDILVSVIGSRAGTTSDDGKYSISQRELKRAHEKGKQIYIFVEKSVLENYEFYRLNRDQPKTNYSSGSVPLFRFIEEVQALPQNNALAAFELSSDIISYLRSQWSGLFHRLLQESARYRERELETDLRSTVATLRQLVDFLTEERKNSSESIRQILLANHPAFSEIRQKLDIKHRVFFTSIQELTPLLGAYGYDPDPFMFEEFPTGHYEWLKSCPREDQTLVIHPGVFDHDGNIIQYDGAEWDSNLVELKRKNKFLLEEDYDPFSE